jgi:hypothetical protein
MLSFDGDDDGLSDKVFFGSQTKFICCFCFKRNEPDLKCLQTSIYSLKDEKVRFSTQL